MTDFYTALIAELRDDPAGIGYAAMSDQQALDTLKAATVERIRSSMSGNELFVATVPAEFGAMTVERRQLWIAFCSGSTIDPSHATVVEFVKWIFGAESQTVAALAEARKEQIPRVVHLGIAEVQIGNVTSAREIMEQQ